MATRNEQAIVNAQTVTWFKHPDASPLKFYAEAYAQAKARGNEKLIAHYAKMIADTVLTVIPTIGN